MSYLAYKIIIKNKPFESINTFSYFIFKYKTSLAFYNYIASLKTKRVLFNTGTENLEFYTILNENNIEYREACTLVLLSTNQY